MSQTISSTERSSLRFHENHGRHLNLEQHRTIARSTSYKGGFVFSSRPLNPNEKFTIKVTCLDKYYTGIKIGLTSNDPANPCYRPKRHHLKDKRGYWTCSIPKHVTENDYLFVCFDEVGIIHYGLNGEETGQFGNYTLRKVPLWAFVSIKYESTAIELFKLDPFHIFHQEKGKNVIINKNIARKKDKSWQTSYCFTARPINVFEQVTVKILETEERYDTDLKLGLTSCDPAMLLQEHLPDNLVVLLDRPEYWVFMDYSGWKVEKNDRISFLTNRNGKVKIWKNESVLLKEIYVDPLLKLWAFCDLSTGNVIEITTRFVKPQKEKRVAPPVPRLDNEGNSQVLQPNNENENKEDSSSQSNTHAVESTNCSECVVCCENATDVALYPCGHMVLCNQCAIRQWQQGGNSQCPICRSTIKDVLKIYKS